MKTGWWEVNFSIDIEGEEVAFENLPDTQQEYIVYMISQGFTSGQIIMEDDDV